VCAAAGQDCSYRLEDFGGAHGDQGIGVTGSIVGGGRHQALAELETVKDSKFLVNDSNQ